VELGSTGYWGRRQSRFRASLLPARLSCKGAIVYSIDPAGRKRGLVRRPFPGWVGFGLLLLLVPAALAATHTVFPFFPLFPVVLFFFAMRMIGSAARRGGSRHQEADK
jgi:hypothetical protein